MIEIGHATIVGDSTIEQTVALPKLPPVKRVLINYYYDVLSTEN
jgi:hypothetical protein